MDIIDNYNQLPLGKYLDIIAADKDEALDDFGKQVRILSILSGWSEEEICHLPIEEYKTAVARSRFLEGADENNRHQVCKKYKIGEWELVPVLDFRKMETAQYVDFKTFAPDYDTRMAELLSTMLVPKGKRYNEGYDILEVQQALKDGLSVSDAATLCAFFLTSSKHLIATSQNFCKSEIARMKPGRRRTEMEERLSKARTLLAGGGDGLRM